jgi:DNA-binding winged helix-turn-helix (wHTH) protein
MAMSKPAKHLYQFGPFSVDVAERVLWREGRPMTLPPKAFELLLVLVEHRGHPLEKDELMRRLWPDTFLEEANLANNISLLRKAGGRPEAAVHRDGAAASGLSPRHHWREA